eukprot:3214607-Prymnesium_polylepis.1
MSTELEGRSTVEPLSHRPYTNLILKRPPHEYLWSIFKRWRMMGGGRIISCARVAFGKSWPHGMTDFSG